MSGSDIDCAEERLDVFGAIQHHAKLLVTTQHSNTTIQASANIAQQALGKDARLLVQHMLERDDANYEVRKHVMNALHVWEIVEGKQTSVCEEINKVEFKNTQSPFELITMLSNRIQQDIGFDSVMFYTFDKLNRGCVISDTSDSKKSLGIFFPENVVPSQVRELSLRVPIRYVRDSTQRNIPLTPEVIDGYDPLDMTFMFSRGVSENHLKMLRHMRVKSSLAISLKVFDKLYGIFSCQSYKNVIPLSVSDLENLTVFASTVCQRIESRIQMFRSPPMNICPRTIRECWGKVISIALKRIKCDATILIHNDELLEHVGTVVPFKGLLNTIRCLEPLLPSCRCVHFRCVQELFLASSKLHTSKMEECSIPMSLAWIDFGGSTRIVFMKNTSTKWDKKTFEDVMEKLETEIEPLKANN